MTDVLRCGVLATVLLGCSASHLAPETSTASDAAIDDASDVCPMPIPHDGTPCTHENTLHGHPQCTYVTTCGTTLATCSGGHWGVSACAP